jgi:hypothetical protein
MYGVWGLRLEGYLEDTMLDPGRDDYYAHGGTWWDVQDSLWLSRLDVLRHRLAVSIGGAQRVRVQSDLSGIDCPFACAADFDSGTPVRLDVEANLGEQEDIRFVGWRGGCEGTEACALTIDRPHRVEAVFGPGSYPFRITVTGAGRVVMESWQCARRCDDRFEADTSFRFRAVPRRGWRFAGWSGACRVRGRCVVRFDRPRQLHATFRRRS